MGDSAFVKVLKISPFRNLWLSQLVSQIFLNLLFFSLIIRVYELTRSNSAVSLMVLLVTLPNIFLGVLAGILVDRSERKIIMFFSHFLRVFAVLAFLLSSETLGWLYVLALLISTITQFFFPAEAASIHEYVSDKKMLLTANSLFSVTFFASVIIGNVLAGPFLLYFGPHGTYFLVSSAFLLASFFTARLPGIRVIVWIKAHVSRKLWRLPWTREEWKTPALFSDFLLGLDHLYKTALVRRGIIILGTSQIMIGVLGTIAPGFADTILKIPVTDVSLLVMAPAAVGMVLGAIIVGQYFTHAKKGPLIKTALLLAALLVLIFSLIDKIALLFHSPVIFANLIVLLFLGAANAFLDVPVNALIQENTPEEIRSRVYGVVASVVGLGALVPIVLAGVFADMVGVRLVMLIAGLAIFIFALYHRLNGNHAS